MIIANSALTQAIDLNKSFRIIPSGKFRSIDGRPGDNKDWNLSEANGRKIIGEVAGLGQDYLIDYEHQSLKGVQAPAAGWFHQLEWKPDGLYIKNARWTEAAKDLIRAKEYRFVSPVFSYTPDLEIVGLVSVAITNTPALPRLTDLSNIALSQHKSLSDAFNAHFNQQRAALQENKMSVDTGMTDEEVQKMAHLFGHKPGVFKAELQANLVAEKLKANGAKIYNDTEIEGLARTYSLDVATLTKALRSKGM